MTGSCSIHILKAERRCQYEIRSKSSPVSCGSPECISGTDAEWTLNLSAFVLALPMLYIFGCGLYTLYCQEWMQFLILLVAEFGCFLLLTAGTVIVEAVEWFSGWIAEL